MKRLFLFFFTILSFSSFAQIYAPESINMPGTWDSWTNPPGNKVFANDTQSVGGKITLISGLLVSHYQTVFSTPTDIQAGTYQFIFTSGSSSNYWANKWTNIFVKLDTIQTFTWHNDEGGKNDTITLNDNKFYIVNFENTGYANTRAIFMELSGTPVSIVSSRRTISIPDSTQNDTIIIRTSQSPCAEQHFYARYTTNNWANSHIAKFTFIQDSAFAVIPKQSENTDIEYYIFSTSVKNPISDFDLIAINFDNNSAKNYKYTVSGKLSCNGESSVLTTNPIFPLENGSVIITFDATLGNGALAGDTSDIYAHIGLITSKSTSSSDWKYVKTSWGQNSPETKFSRVGDDLYQLTISNIRSYFAVPSDEKILKIAMVIRSAKPIDATKPQDFYVARNSDGSDMFIDVYDNTLATKITDPSKKKPLVPLNSIIPVCAYAMGQTIFNLYIDGSKVDSTTSDTIIYGLNTSLYSAGLHTITSEVVNGTNIIKDSTRFYIRPKVTIEDLPAGMHNGINYIDDNTVTLVLEDPIATKEFAFVIGDFNNWQISDKAYMKKTPDGKYFWITIKNLTKQKEYAFQYYIDGKITIADPYCDKILDPWNDKYIPKYNYPNLKQYPFNKTKGIVSVFQTGQIPYSWNMKKFVPKAINATQPNLIIYELLIRDFVSTSTIKDVEKRLDYLKSLGINAIELMPFNEFEGNISWGYNPDFYFAPDKYYGTKNDYKHFIDACHQKGIAVIMDIVLNHSFGQSPMVQMYWDSDKKEPAANNPWYNQVSPHPLSPGYDFNHESVYTKQFVKSVLKYWLSDYKIDGFRFDLAKGFTQTHSSNIEDWSKYDQSRVDIWKDYYSYIKSVDSNAYVILEEFADNDEEKTLANTGMLLWGNMNKQFSQASMAYSSNSDFSQALYSNRSYTYPNLIPYMESHDEERIMYNNLTYGNSNASYDIKKLETALNSAAEVAAFYLLIPGPKMIWQFGELGYDYSIDYCKDGTINEDCRTSPKPLHWKYLDDKDRRKVFAVYQILDSLKTNEEAFRSGNFSFDVSGTGKREWISSSNFNLVAAGNFDITDFDMTYNFQHTGTWYDLFNQSSIDVTNVNETKNFAPGEFHIYTDKYIPLGTVPEKNTELSANSIQVFPNPTSNYLTIKTKQNFSLFIYDMTGKLIKYYSKISNNQTVDISALNKGFYTLVLKNDTKIINKKFIVN